MSRSAALSRAELAGRGAGRGGSSSAVAMGSTRPGSWPAASRTARAKPNHEVTPALVTWKVPGSRSVPSTARTPARSAVKVGLPRWSSTKRSGPGWPARRSTVRTMLAPCAPHTHDVRTTVDAGVELELAAELAARRTPTSGWARPTRGRGAVEVPSKT